MNRRKIVSIMLCCFFLAVTFFFGLGNVAVTAEERTEIDLSEKRAGDIVEIDGQEYEVVVSYEDIIKLYYMKLSEATEGAISITLDEFRDGVLRSQKDIVTYTYELSEEITNGVEEPGESVQPSSASPSGDADYILSATTYNVTPNSEFKRTPVYDGRYDYSTLTEGDIVFETQTIGSFGHTAIISDMFHQANFGLYTSDYIQTIEAVGGGVQYGFLDDVRMIDYAIIIYRVKNSTPTIRQNAVSFCRSQLGKPYHLAVFIGDFKKDTAPTTSAWYCSELLYAAYYNNGIDIDIREDGSDGEKGILPLDIYASANVNKIFHFMENCLGGS